MAVPHLSNGAGLDAGSPLPLDQRKQQLSATLQSKVEQGYRIESQTDTTATVVTRGRRHWLGLRAGKPATDTREIISIDEQGHTKTRSA